MVLTTFRSLLYVITLLLFIPSINCVSRPQILGSQGVNFWKLAAARTAHGLTGGSSKRSSALVVQDPQTLRIPRTTDFRARWFEQPLDHFSNTSTYKFHQRYWVNDRHYTPNNGAPVIVLDGGETSGQVRIFTTVPEDS